ncbi:hypothetical protein ACVWY2_008815 [Bradyrhizobium sp. JR6.1]
MNSAAPFLSKCPPFPRFPAGHNPPVKMARDLDCHATPEAIATTREFVRSLGAPVVLNPFGGEPIEIVNVEL